MKVQKGERNKVALKKKRGREREKSKKRVIKSFEWHLFKVVMQGCQLGRFHVVLNYSVVRSLNEKGFRVFLLFLPFL